MGILSKWLHNVRIKITKQYIKGNVLDIGCGSASIFTKFNHRINKYYGVEYDQKHISGLNQKYIKNKKVKFFQKDLDTDKLNFDIKFDCIIILAVIEHIYNQKHFIIELVKNLKPNGKLVITTPTPFGNDIVHRIGASIGLFNKVQGDDHVVIYNKKRFKILAKDFGLDIKKYKTFEFNCNQLVVFEKSKQKVKSESKTLKI